VRPLLLGPIAFADGHKVNAMHSKLTVSDQDIKQNAEGNILVRRISHTEDLQ
jgi:hypothetical protein